METKNSYPDPHFSFTGSMRISFKETNHERHYSVNGLKIDSKGCAEFTGTCVTVDHGEKCLKLFKGNSGKSNDLNNQSLELNPDEVLTVVSLSGNVIWENPQ